VDGPDLQRFHLHDRSGNISRDPDANVIHLRPRLLQGSSEHHEKGRGATVTEDCAQGENRFPVGTLNVINREQHWLLLADGSEDLEEGSTNGETRSLGWRETIGPFGNPCRQDAKTLRSSRGEARHVQHAPSSEAN
jgi:hypothetical protein